MPSYEQIDVSDELATAITRYGLQNQLTPEEAITTLIGRGLECLPGGCFCGQQRQKRMPS